MHRTVIGCVIYGGRHCRRAKIFYLSQLGIKPMTLDLQGNTLPRRCKSWLLPQGSRSVYIYIPRHCDMGLRCLSWPLWQATLPEHLPHAVCTYEVIRHLRGQFLVD